MKKTVCLVALLMLMIFAAPSTIHASDTAWMDKMELVKAVGDEYAMYEYSVDRKTTLEDLQKMAASLEKKEFPYEVVEVLISRPILERATFKKVKGKDGVESHFIPFTPKAIGNLTAAEANALDLNTLLSRTGYKISLQQILAEYGTNAVAFEDKFKDLEANITGVVKQVTVRTGGEANEKLGCVVFEGESDSGTGVECCTPIDVSQPLPLKDIKPGDKVAANATFSQEGIAYLEFTGCLFSKAE